MRIARCVGTRRQRLGSPARSGCRCAPMSENRERDPHPPSLTNQLPPEAGVWSPPEAGSFSHVNRVVSFSSSSMILSISAGLPPEAGIKPYAGVCMDRSSMATLYANAQWHQLSLPAAASRNIVRSSPLEHANGCGTFSSPRTSRSARASRQKSRGLGLPPIAPPRPSGQPSGRAPPTAARHAPQNGQALPLEWGPK